MFLTEFTSLYRQTVISRDSANGPKMSLNAAMCEGVDKIHLAQVMAFVDMIMNLQVL